MRRALRLRGRAVIGGDRKQDMWEQNDVVEGFGEVVGGES
jgi:hypothetical protein